MSACFFVAEVERDERRHIALGDLIAVLHLVRSGSWTISRAAERPAKPHAYAAAGVPVYLVVDRQRRLVLPYTDPRQGRYGTRTEHRPGETCHLPASVGAPVAVDVNALLGPAPG